MNAALARRIGGRVTAAALAVLLGAASMMLGAGTANAAPRQVVCQIGASTEPVKVTEGEQVQLVINLAGVLVKVGEPQTVKPETEVLSAVFTNALGIVVGLCSAAVDVQRTVTSAVPLPPPPVTVPALPVLPSLLPSSVALPVPGVDVAVEQGSTVGATPPAGGPTPPAGQVPTQPGTNQPPTSSPRTPDGYFPGYRFQPGAVPRYDFSSLPYGPSARFSDIAVPAFRFGQQVPGYAPQFGVLGPEAARNATAGRVQALPLGGPTAVGLPVLLAVLMLSTVSGALVRTWTLRRVA